MAYAKAIGGTRAGSLKPISKEETETRSLLVSRRCCCGGLSELVKAGFETLGGKAGYPARGWP